MGKPHCITAISLIAGLVLALSTAPSAAAQEAPARSDQGMPVANEPRQTPKTSENTCKGVKKKLRKMEKNGDHRGVICHRTSTPPKGSDIEAKQKAAMANLNTVGPNATPLPDWCKAKKGGEWVYGERRAACRRKKGNTLTLYKMVNGVPTLDGKIWYIVADLITVDDTDDSSWKIVETIKPYKFYKNTGGATVSGMIYCTDTCHRIRNSYIRQPFVRGQVITGSATFVTEVSKRWETAEVATNIYRVHGKPGYTLGFQMMHGAKIRCDRAVPAKSTDIGCVFRQFAPTMEYKLGGNAKYPQLARHIKLAQDSGLPGKPGGTPLHRIVYRRSVDKNNYVRINGDTACPKKWTRPPDPSGGNKQCDEYPMRSTVEGAYTAHSYTPDDPATPPMSPYPPRTHDKKYCGTFPKNSAVKKWDPDWDKDPVGYSVCWINGKQNTSGGNALKNELYTPERVLQGDAFYVKIVS